jgi:hypothetical protein
MSITFRRGCIVYHLSQLRMGYGAARVMLQLNVDSTCERPCMARAHVVGVRLTNFVPLQPPPVFAVSTLSTPTEFYYIQYWHLLMVTIVATLTPVVYVHGESQQRGNGSLVPQSDSRRLVGVVQGKYLQ